MQVPKLERIRSPEEYASSVGMRHPMQMIRGNLAQFNKKSNSVIRSRLVTGSNIGVKSDQWMMSLYSEGRITIRKGRPHIVWKDPRTDHRTSLEANSNVQTYPFPTKLIGKSQRPYHRTFIIGACPSVSEELWDKYAIGGRRWDVATQERNVCNMEDEIVTLVVKGSAKLTVPTNWQEQIQVGSRSIVLCCVFDLKHMEIHLTKIILKVWVINEQYVIDVSICLVEPRCLPFPNGREQWPYEIRLVRL